MTNWMTGFNNATAGETEFKEIPEGVYTARVADSSVDKTKEPWRAVITWEIVGGEFYKRKVFASYQCNEQGGPFLKADLNALGVKQQITTDNLPMMLATVQNSTKQIYVKHRQHNGKTYHNAYIQHDQTSTSATIPPVGQGAPQMNQNDKFGF